MSEAQFLMQASPRQPHRRHPLLDLGGSATLLILTAVFVAPTLAWIEWGRTDGYAPHASVELRMLVWSALLSLLLPVLQINMHIRRFGGSAIRGNRDAYPRLDGIAGRISRAHLNAIESLVPFAAVILAAQAMMVSTRWTVAASVLYLVARVAHSLCYALGVTVLRSSAFYAGWLATVTIAIVLLLG